MEWLADCLCLSLSPCWLLLSVSIHCNKVYQPICLCLSEFMAEWINDPQLWPCLFMSLSVRFLPICLRMPFNPFPPSGDVDLVLFAWVSILTKKKKLSLLSCLATFHHLSNWSLCYKTFSFASDLNKRHSETTEMLCNSLSPRRICSDRRDSFIYRSCPDVPCRQLPHAPENPTAVLSTSEKRAIDLAWAKPFDGNSPLIRYILEVSENSKSHLPSVSQSCIHLSHPSLPTVLCCPLCHLTQL